MFTIIENYQMYRKVFTVLRINKKYSAISNFHKSIKCYVSFKQTAEHFTNKQTIFKFNKLLLKI